MLPQGGKKLRTVILEIAQWFRNACKIRSQLITRYPDHPQSRYNLTFPPVPIQAPRTVGLWVWQCASQPECPFPPLSGPESYPALNEHFKAYFPMTLSSQPALLPVGWFGFLIIYYLGLNISCKMPYLPNTIIL